MTVYRHGNKFRADIYHEGERVARESFDTKAEALKFERLETARQLLSEEERYRRDVQEWARHHRFVEKPEYMQRIAEHGRKTGLLEHLTRFGDALPARDDRHGAQPSNSMLIYVEDPARQEAPVQLKPVSTVKLGEALERCYQRPECALGQLSGDLRG